MTGEGGRAALGTPGEQAGESRHDPHVNVMDAPPRLSETEPRCDGALRRTLLAAERTYLLLAANGVGTIAVSIAVGCIAPALLSSSHVAYAPLSAGYGVLGIFFNRLRARAGEATRRRPGRRCPCNPELVGAVHVRFHLGESCCIR
jgi:hypothetical protein